MRARTAPWGAAEIRMAAQRRAYGRRRCSATLVEDLRYLAVPEYAAPSWISRYSVATPHGGERWLLGCPRCQRRVTRLYHLDQLTHSPWGAGYGCRACMQLRYASQYMGRRPEAHATARAALARSADRATTDHARTRRHTRWLAATQTVNKRLDRYIVQSELSFALLLLTVEARLERSPIQAREEQRDENVAQCAPGDDQPAPVDAVALRAVYAAIRQARGQERDVSCNVDFDNARDGGVRHHRPKHSRGE